MLYKLNRFPSLILLEESVPRETKEEQREFLKKKILIEESLKQKVYKNQINHRSDTKGWY